VESVIYIHGVTMDTGFGTAAVTLQIMLLLLACGTNLERSLEEFLQETGMKILLLALPPQQVSLPTIN
jgi:hypothetical protein